MTAPSDKKIGGFATCGSSDVETSTPIASPLPNREHLQSLVTWTLPSLNSKEIHSKLQSHEHFEVKSGYAMSGLPKFHDLTQYEISAEDEGCFWKKEVARLVDTANSPLPVDLSGNREWFGNADGNGYTNLHRVTLQLQDALDICIHDNELLLVEHMPTQADHQSLMNARNRLLRDYDHETGEERFQRRLRLAEDNDRYYHALVNYITAMMLRVLLRTMRGALWEEHCIMTVAKFSAKLKILLKNLPKSASTSLRRTEEVRFKKNYKKEIQEEIGYDDQMPEVDSKELKERSRWQPGRLDAEMRYFIVMKTFNLGISRLLLSVLSNLSSNEDTEMSADLFDTSVLMYEDYIMKHRLSLLCSQRDGTIGAASDQRVIESAAAAFEVCLDVWKSLGGETKDESIKSKEHWTELSWMWTELDRHDFSPRPNHIASSVDLSDMKSFITAFVPYSMVCGSFPSLLHDMSNNVSLIADPTAPVKLVRPKLFLASFTVRTSAHMSRRMNLFKVNDACDLSRSVLVHDKALARSPTRTILSKYADEDETVSDMTLRDRRDAQRKKMGKAMEEFQTWIIDETTIVIPNKLYAWGFLSAGSLLVLGGLAMGLTVGERIDGVDPLGFTTFCWVLAGFVLLVAKSLRVENWPWSRFFRGQVVCRSVNEVHSVTGMDTQIILAILLRLEPRMILIKRGPFNAVFSKKGADGFAIDVPFNTSTLMEGGVILVKVQSLVGDALVGIRSDLWTKYDSVSPKGENAKAARVVCRDFQDPARLLKLKGDLYTLSSHEIQWFRVLGLFEKDAYFN
jgi:hypothetical protein